MSPDSVKKLIFYTTDKMFKRMCLHIMNRRIPVSEYDIINFEYKRSVKTFILCSRI